MGGGANDHTRKYTEESVLQSEALGGGGGRGGVRRTGQVFRRVGYVPCLVQQPGAPRKAMARAKGGRKGGWVGDGVRCSHSTELRHLAPLPFTAAASRAHPRVPTRCNDRPNGLFAADGAGLYPHPASLCVAHPVGPGLVGGFFCCSQIWLHTRYKSRKKKKNPSSFFG